MQCNKPKTLILIIFLFILKSTIISFGQQNFENEFVHKNLIMLGCSKVDSLFRTDFLLKNGRIYSSEFSRAKGHPYFNSNQWTSSCMVIGEKIYPNIPLLFDIYNDKVLCKIKGKDKDEIIIEPNNLNVRTFSIEGHEFLNCNLLPDLPQHGFYEIIYRSNSLQVYYKWTIAYVDIATIEYSGMFDKQKQVIYMFINGKINRIDSSRDLYKLFNADKNKVKSYTKINKLKLFKADKKEMILFFQFLENLK